MLKVEDWIQIRELARHKVPLSEIARQTGHDRKTVRKVLLDEAPKTHANLGKERGGKLEPYRDYLRQRIAQGCLNGQVLLEEISSQGYKGKITILSDFLTPIRQEIIRKEEATIRFETGPGKQAQVDWGSFGRVFDKKENRWRKLYAFVFTLGYSRALYLEFTTSCDSEHFLSCHLNAFEALGIPDSILYDNLKTAILGRKPDGTPNLPGRFLDFALLSGFTPSFCKPYRPKTKGKVERTIRYVRGNFWQRVKAQVEEGKLGLCEINERARSWASDTANARVHGTHGEVVSKRLEAEMPHLSRHPDSLRVNTDYHSLRRVGRDGRLSYRGVSYQLGLSLALLEVEVRESLSGKVTIWDKKGQILEIGPIADAKASRSLAGPNKQVARNPHRLHLLLPELPEVQTRDLSLYEEVALGCYVG